jgi:hypothetical protein
MVMKNIPVLRVFLYLLLFLFSFLIFDSATVAGAVGVALMALYHFSSKWRNGL